jgi:hypothetical protein
MALTDEIIQAARTASDKIETHLDEDPRFGPFAQRVTPEWLRLIQARRDFRASGSSGSPELLVRSRAALDAAIAMQPDNASVNRTLAAVGRLSEGLTQATGGNARSASFEPPAKGVSFGALRGSLRLSAPTSRASPGGVLRGARPSPGALSDGNGKGSGGDPGYYQKLTNLFPAEALALYGTGVALFGGATPFVVIAALIVLLLLRLFASQPAEGGPPEWLAVAVAASSYLLWVTATDPGWLSFATTPGEDLRRGAAFLGAALVVIAPMLVKTQASPPG